MLAWLGRVDPTTVGIAFGLAGLAMTAVIALLARVGDWTRSLSWWVGAAFCLTAGYMLNMAQTHLLQAWTMAISNPLTIVGACLFYVGVRHVEGKPAVLLQIAPIIVLSIVGNVLFVVIWPSLPARVFVQLLCLLIVTYLNVSALRKLDHGYYHFPARFLLIANAALVLLLFARGAIVFFFDEPVTAVQRTPVTALVFSVAGFLILMFLVGILLICFAEKQTLLRRLATEDYLTGALNRLGLRDTLATWPAGRAGVVTLFDIDHFKRVNDSFGHETGDELLRVFARGLLNTAPEGAIIARLGGDEFCVVEQTAAGVFSSDWIKTLKRQLATQLTLPTAVAHSCRVSHGSAAFADAARDFTQALRSADSALYRSKARKLLRDKKPIAAQARV